MPAGPHNTSGPGFFSSRIHATVREKYFPELWYTIDSWFTIVKGRQLLEVGYGTGMLGAAFAKTGWKLTLVDPDLGALAELREKFAREKLDGTFEQADMNKLPFPSGSFDAVLSINSLEQVAKPVEALREICRVLKPGGRAAIATFNKASPWALNAVIQAMRMGHPAPAAKFLSRNQLRKALGIARLTEEDFKERARYLPGTTGAMAFRLPLAGAFVTLVAAPS